MRGFNKKNQDRLGAYLQKSAGAVAKKKRGRKRKHPEGTQQRVAEGFKKYTITISTEQLAQVFQVIAGKKSSPKTEFADALSAYIKKNRKYL
jgi:hypothetical protein